MLGVFKRRWKPKRVASDSIRPAVPESASPEPPPERFARQVYPLAAEPGTLSAYDTTMRRKAKADRNIKSEHQNNKGANQADYSDLHHDHLANRGAYPMAPNICVEGGRIEFVKAAPDGRMAQMAQTPPASPLGVLEEEKFDGDKEALEARIRLLEQRLEAEALSAQKDRLAVARLQHQLSKRTGGGPRDADRARPDALARLARAEHEAERANQRLRAAHKEIARMEETVRSLLQYKSRVEALKQEKSSLSAALEARSIHYQTSLSKLSAENESLRSQVATLQAARSQAPVANRAATEQAASPDQAAAAPATGGEVDSGAVSHGHPGGSPDPQKKQYERCLDDVANQVVRALLSQKGLREELSRLSVRARELEAQNRSLGALLLRQLRPRAAPSPASPDPSQDLQLGSNCCNSAAITSLNSAEFISSPATNILSNKVNYHTGFSPRERFIQKNNRLYKSNDDINATKDRASKQYNNDNKRFSAGNIIIPSCGNKLCSANSIISFKDEPISDLMSVCVTHHTYQLSAEDKRRHQILTELWTELKGIEVTPHSLLQALRAVDPSLWAPPERPLTLNLKVPPPTMLSHCLHRLSQTLPDHLPQQSTEDEVTVESPESGNRDEGYSTMSSDVQADPCRQGEPNRELEDLKEASDETENQVLLNINNAIIVEDKADQEILYIPINFALSFNNPRNSYPPTKSINPFQHIMRSFSDSNLCLKLTTSTTQCGENCFTFSSPSSPSMILLDVMPIIQRDKKNHPLRRTRGTASLISPSPIVVDNTESISNSRTSWVSNIDEQVDGCQYDAEYVQHWLQLDDTRSALQQQHRDQLDLEYDQAEMEDWSLNLSCEDLQENHWKRNSSITDVMTPGQISLSTLPSIQENNTLELEEDVSECLWNNSSYMLDTTSDKFAPLSLENDSENHKRDENHWPYPPMENSGLPSPGGSWSSIENSEDCCINNECFYNNDNLVDNDVSKRSSAAMSGYSDEPESSAVGTDFTRDFYRLVKFESTKSLASNSSRGLGAGGGQDHSAQILKLPEIQFTLKQEREQALQNVLNFIAEQQKYCHNREELDSLPSRPISEIRELPPPYIDCQDFNTDETIKHLNEIKFNQGSCRDSLASEIIYSENESCDIILSNDFNSMYSDVSPDLTKVPRIIDNQNEEFLSDSEGFINIRDFHDTENEIDEQHLLKVHQKNEINKNIDVNISTNSTTVSEDEPFSFSNAKNIEGHIHTNGIAQAIDATVTVDPIHFEKCVTAQTSGGCNYSVTEIGSCDKTASFSDLILNSNDSECSLLEEVLNACKRGNGSLVTVPEEEETTMENSLTQTSDSMTTSVSTSDTIATEICKSKKKITLEKSKIPVAASSATRKQSQIPVKSKSKIPVAETSKNVSTVETDGECSFKECKVSPGSIIVSQGPSHSRIVSFHEAATSKDVIDELNRMIRKGEDGVGNSDNEAPTGQSSNLDKALWCPTGWVHVEREIDFSDPKARANLLDVMLASSDSSPSPTSSCAGSFSSDSGDDRADYSRLHRLHRYRRQKKAAALRERGLAVLRFSCFHRPTIIGRNDFFVRYGKEEREAVACFDFLEDISSSVNLVTSMEEANISTLENQISQDSGKASQRSIDFCHKHGPDSDSSRETFSDSCAVSFSGSEISFEDNTP